MRRRYRLLGACIGGVAAIAIAGLLIRAGSSHGGSPAGPLHWLGVPDSISAPMPVGSSFTYGHVVVVNRSHRSLTLRSVSLENATPGLDVIAVNADLPSRDATNGLVARAPTYPPRGGPTLHPLAGFTVPANGLRAGAPDPAKVVNIVLGLRIPGERRYSFTAMIVTYSLGGATYSLRVPQEFAACGTRDYPRTTRPCVGLPL